MEECTEFCRITARLAANKAKRDHEAEGTVKEKKSDVDEHSQQKRTATLNPITAALHNKDLYLTESLKTRDSPTEIMLT